MLVDLGSVRAMPMTFVRFQWTAESVSMLPCSALLLLLISTYMAYRADLPTVA